MAEHNATVEVIALDRDNQARCDCGFTGEHRATYGEANRDIGTHFLDVCGPTECDMKHRAPFDFAWCETHDTTFPLGGTCPTGALQAQAAAGG